MSFLSQRWLKIGVRKLKLSHERVKYFFYLLSKSSKAFNNPWWLKLLWFFYENKNNFKYIFILLEGDHQSRWDLVRKYLKHSESFPESFWHRINKNLSKFLLHRSESILSKNLNDLKISLLIYFLLKPHLSFFFKTLFNPNILDECRCEISPGSSLAF